MSKYQSSISTELYTRFGFLRIQENKRPGWLITDRGERLELDFYLPEMQIAVEVQGAQHYKYIPHFHKDFSEFTSQVRRDQAKKSLCDKEGIALLEIYDEVSRKDAMEFIDSSWKEKITLSSSDAMIVRSLKKVVKSLVRWEKKGATRRIRTGFRRLQYLMEHGGYARFSMLPSNIQNSVGYFVKKYESIVLYIPSPPSLFGKRFRGRIKRAKERYVVQIEENMWYACGGYELHVLHTKDYEVMCDCIKSKDQIDPICCHVLLYYKTVYGEYFPKEAISSWSFVFD